MPPRRSNLVQGYGALHPTTAATPPYRPCACRDAEAHDLACILALRGELHVAIHRLPLGRRVADTYQVPTIFQPVLIRAVDHVDGIAIREAVLATAGRLYGGRDDFNARLRSRGGRTLLGDGGESAGEGKFPVRGRGLEEGTVFFRLRLVFLLVGSGEDELWWDAVPKLPREPLHLRAASSRLRWDREGWGCGRIRDADL